MEDVLDKPKTILEIEKEVEENLHQFTFVMFIPNPMNHMVQFYVDDGSISNLMDKDKFVKIIKDICGAEEANKINLACMEYGTPYLYDRENRILRQLNSLSEGRNLDLSKKNALSQIEEERALKSPYHNQTFENMNSVYNKIMNIKIL